MNCGSLILHEKLKSDAIWKMQTIGWGTFKASHVIAVALISMSNEFSSEVCQLDSNWHA